MKKKINRLFLLLIFSLSFIILSSCNFQETENHTGLGYIRISCDEEEKSRTNTGYREDTISYQLPGERRSGACGQHALRFFCGGWI